MNFGEKILSLYKITGHKNFQDYGKAVGLSGDWLLDMSKKESIQTVDVTRLVKLCNYHNISLDRLLNNDKENNTIENNNLDDFDIGGMLENIQTKLKDQDVKFYGFNLSRENIKLLNDSIEVVKNLVKNNL